MALFQDGVKEEDQIEEQKEIERMSLETLQKLSIAFGKAKLGQSFKSAFSAIKAGRNGLCPPTRRAPNRNISSASGSCR